MAATPVVERTDAWRKNHAITVASRPEAAWLWNGHAYVRPIDKSSQALVDV
jgi:hypothetical protein